MNPSTPFPKEFTHHAIRDMDKEFVYILLITFLVLVACIGYMSAQPVKTINSKDLANHINWIYSQVYRVKITKDQPLLTRSRKDKPETIQNDMAELNTPENTQSDNTDNFAEVNNNSKATPTNQPRSRINRIENLRNERAKNLEAARNMHKLVAPTSRKADQKKSGSSENYQEFGLTPNSKKTYDLKTFSGISNSASPVQRQKGTYQSTAITEVTEDINISRLNLLTDVDYDLIFEDAVPNIGQEPVFTKETGAHSLFRNSESISKVVFKNQNQIKYCFWAEKRRDSALTGRVVVEFTINPAGKVIAVKIAQSQWTNPFIGKKVETSIKNIISGWRFSAITGESTDFTAGATYIFD